MARPQLSAASLQKKINVDYKNEVCEVFELAKKHGLPAKLIEVDREGPIHQGIFTFCFTVGDFEAVAQGPTRSKTKILAAQKLLPDLRSLPLPHEVDEPSKWRRKKKKHSGLWKELPLCRPDEDPLEVLDKLLKCWRGMPPEVKLLDIDKESQPWIYFVQLKVAGEAMVGLGHSKILAKRNAAAKILNSFGYNFMYTEPKPTPPKIRQEVHSAPENKNVPEAFLKVPHVIIEDEQEEECPVPQNNSTQPEEEMQPSAEDPKMVSEEVTSPEEGAANLTQEEPSTPVQGVTAQSSVDILQQVHPDLLPMLANMRVIVTNNGTVEWGKTSLQLEKQTSSATEVVTSLDLPEINVTINPDVDAQEDTSTSLETASEKIQEEPFHIMSVDVTGEYTTEVSLESTSKDEICDLQEEVQTPSVDTVPQEGTVDTSLGNRAQSFPVNDQEHSFELIQEDTSQIKKEEIQPAVNLQVLPAEILARLAFMGVIEENNGIVGWSEPKATTTCDKEPQDVCCTSQTLTKEDQSSDVPVTVGGTSGETQNPSDIFTEDTTTLVSRPEMNSEPSENISTVERSSKPSDISAIPTRTSPPVPYRVSFFVTRALLIKVFKKAGSYDPHNTSLMTVNLHKNIQDHLEFSGDGEIRLQDLDKIGKAAAKHLAVEYGSAEALLRAARGEDTAAFEAAVVKHLNSELKAFHQRPKSALSRFFSRLRRAFTRH